MRSAHGEPDDRRHAQGLEDEPPTRGDTSVIGDDAEHDRAGGTGLIVIPMADEPGRERPERLTGLRSQDADGAAEGHSDDHREPLRGTH